MEKEDLAHPVAHLLCYMKDQDTIHIDSQKDSACEIISKAIMIQYLKTVK